MRTVLHRWLMVFALMPMAAHAADGRATAPGGMSYDTRISEYFSYDSNPLRIAGSSEHLLGSTTSPQLIIRHKSPRTLYESDTRIDANFFNRSEYNSNDLHQNFFLQTENARWIASMKALADYDTTRTSELTNYTLNLPKVRRTQLGVSPQLTFKKSARDSITINSSATRIYYDNNAYSDYGLYSLTPSYTRQIDPFNQTTVSFQARRYETTTGTKLTSDSFGPSIGFTSKISQHWTTRLSAGGEHTHKKNDATATTENEWNYVFAAQANYKTMLDSLDLSAKRARQPFGNGTETLLTSFDAKLRHALNPNLAMVGDASYRFADYSSEPGVNLDHGVFAGGGLAYALAKNTELSANYHVRNETLTNTNDSVTQHIVMLGINYQPDWNMR